MVRLNREDLIKTMDDFCLGLFGKSIYEADRERVYLSLVYALRKYIYPLWHSDGKGKRVYYMSMEFLMGRYLLNCLDNAYCEEEVEGALNKLGLTLHEIIPHEPEPALGNGGLGRLAACFLDSAANCGIDMTGCGIRYDYGIFKQKIINNSQVELPDDWLYDNDPWSLRREDLSCIVPFGGTVREYTDEKGRLRFKQENCEAVKADCYDYPVIGYGLKKINTLRLWGASAASEFDLGAFNAGEYEKTTLQSNLVKTITHVLYPADEHIKGKELRLRQQYFFVCASLNAILKENIGEGKDVRALRERAVIHINDTHPTLVICELMRRLIDDYLLSWEEAFDLTGDICFYTNHTILPEAMEKWPADIFSRLLPRIWQIVSELNRRLCEDIGRKYGGDSKKTESMAIIWGGTVRMANLCIYAAKSVNGVAKLHSEILKTEVLKDFYEMYPEKFKNVTNGITPRRWLGIANPGLTGLLSEYIKGDFIGDLGLLSEAEGFISNRQFLERFERVKLMNKKRLARYIEESTGIKVDAASVFDIQAKRLHEYKRQLLNLLYTIDLHNRIREKRAEGLPPVTVIFSAKAAAGYRMAKSIIRLINCAAEKINNDSETNSRLKVIFLENYTVALAELIIPACDISEQISTAGLEASGTGNMKFMLNGAVTLGTLDGANVEMAEVLGQDNIFIFGKTKEELKSIRGSYNPQKTARETEGLMRVLDELRSGFGDFSDIYNSLLYKDEYFVLLDFADYRRVKDSALLAYKDRERWLRMSAFNMAKSRVFSSDRAILEYKENIWGI